jgi:hypothetical protein
MRRGNGAAGGAGCTRHQREASARLGVRQVIVRVADRVRYWQLSAGES